MRPRQATPPATAVAAATGTGGVSTLRDKDQRTRRRPHPSSVETVLAKRRRLLARATAESAPFKRRRLLARDDDNSVRGGVAAVDFFDGLPDDILLCILRRLSSTASKPADLLGVHMTCKRLRSLALHPLVLCRASPKSLAVPASKWSETVHNFLKRCAEAGNLDASYMLGMIRFYCLGNRPGGVSLLARAAMRQHAASLYSLAVIQFNGSGSVLKSSQNLRAGVLLCARAASLGHSDAIRELGHCLQDGYGVRRDVAKGRRFLVQANAREIAASLRNVPNGFARLLAASKRFQQQNHQVLQGQQQQLQQHHHQHQQPDGILPPIYPLWTGFGHYLLPAIPPFKPHPANQFLSGWFSTPRSSSALFSDDLRMCSHTACGRPETRRHEFRRCSVCGKANYCSRACQAMDWRLRHKSECVPVPQWVPVQVQAQFHALPPEVQVHLQLHGMPHNQVQVPADGGAGTAEAAAVVAANGGGAYAAAG